MFFRSRGAFSLLEISIVVVVIAIVASVAFNYFGDTIDDTRLNVLKTNERSVQEAIAKYFKTNMKYPASLEELQGSYLMQHPAKLLLEPGGGKATVQVEVAKSGAGDSLYHVAQSDREWITYNFGAHDGRQIGNVKVFLGDAPTSAPSSPPSGQFQLSLSGTHISSSPAPGMIDSGLLVVITVAPPANYVVNTFTVAGVDRSAELVANQYSFNINANTNVAVTYSVDPVVTAWDPGTAYAGGSIIQHNGAVFSAPWYINAGIEPPNAPWIELTDEWRVNNTYNTGDEVWHNGALFKARNWTQGAEPGIVGNPWDEVTDQWRVFNVYQAGNQAWYNGSLYEAKWYVSAGQAAPDANAAWELK